MKNHPEVIVRNCTFRNNVRFGNCEKSPAIIFIGCKFEQGICAREAVLGKSLKLINCDIESVDKNQRNVALDLENARLEGELFLYNCRLGGRLFAPHLQARTNVRLRGCQVAPALTDIGSHVRPYELTIDQVDSVLMKRGWKIDHVFDVTPAISLEGANIEGDLEITSSTMELTPTSSFAQAAGIHSASISASVIAGHINATGATVMGSTSLLGTICRGSVVFDNSQFDQGVTTTLCVIYGSLVFRNTKFESDVDCAKTSVGADLDLSNASIKGNTECRDSEVRGTLSLRNASVNGSVSLNNANIKGDVLLYRTVVRENVDLLGLRVSKDMKCTFATIGGLWAFQGVVDIDATGQVQLNVDYSLEVKGDLILSGAEIRWVELRGIRVTGKITVITGKFGTLMFSVGLEPTLTDPRTFQPNPSRAAAVGMHAVEVDETLDVSGLIVKIPGGWDSSGRLKESQDAGFKLTQSKIGGDLLFFNPQQKRSLERRIGWPAWKKTLIVRRQRAKLIPNVKILDDGKDFPWSDKEWKKFPEASFWGGLDLQANQIGGQLDLRATYVKGPIYLNDTTVGLDLHMDAFLEENIQNRSRTHVLATTCLHLNAEKLQCNGDVNFTGLRVLRSMKLSEDEKPQLEARKHGVLLAHEARVKGQMLFLPVEKKKQKPHEVALAAKERQTAQHVSDEFVPGYALIDAAAADQAALDLTAVEANYVLLTGHNVPHEAAKVSCERGRFGRLEIVAPPPGPIDLSKATVDRWVFGDKSEPNAVEYVGVLERMDPFDRSIWIGVETSLRNKGLDAEADELYREMRWQARERSVGSERLGRTKGRGAIVGSLVFLILLSAIGFSLSFVLVVGVVMAILLMASDREGLHGAIGWGTRSWVPMVVAVIVFPLSVYIFSTDKYVRASPQLLEALGDERKNIAQVAALTGAEPGSFSSAAGEVASLEISPKRIEAYDSKYQWKSLDAVALALRYQVPVMSSLTHTWWEASGTRIFFLGNITAEQYALILVIYHWIAWPLFLIWLGARVVRGKQS